MLSRALKKATDILQKNKVSFATILTIPEFLQQAIKMFDLHMHSLYSNDGEFSPEQLVENCNICNIKVMSITDHNTVAANFTAQKSAVKHNIKYIPGIEIDCTFENTDFHVLGYQINFQDPAFAEIENNIRTQSMTISQIRLEKIKKLGLAISETELNALSKDSYWPETWTGEMFAEVILSHPAYKNDPRLESYRPGGKRSDNPLANFYWDFFAQGKPCFAKSKFPSMQEIIDIIHATGGYAVLAHPCVNLKGKMHLLSDIAKLKLDGIEAFSSYHCKEEAATIRHFAQMNNLFITCGSDFHGKIKPAISLGQHHCSLTEKELSDQLTKLLRK